MCVVPREVQKQTLGSVGGSAVFELVTEIVNDLDKSVYAAELQGAQK